METTPNQSDENISTILGMSPQPFSDAQISRLQNQIRQFKALSKKHAEIIARIAPQPTSNIPNTTEGKVDDSASSISKSIEVPQNFDTNIQSSIQKPADQETENSSVPQPTLSWQCFGNLLFSGPARPMDGLIAVALSDIGPFSKAAHLPLVLTRPYMASLREQMLCSHKDELEKVFVFQRQQRARLLENYLSSSPVIHPPVSAICSRKTLLRSKKQHRRDSKAAEKEARKRAQEKEDTRRRLQNSFLKAVMAHRDEFNRFHRNKRSDCARAARSVRQWLDTREQRREKDDARAETRRLQALKENDMEAYAKLVQETKNVRLQYLLSETDKYISAIHKLVADHQIDDVIGTTTTGINPLTTPVDVKDEGNKEGEGAVARSGDVVVKGRMVSEGGSSGNGLVTEEVKLVRSHVLQGVKSTEASLKYFESTHRRAEKVSQPHILKGGDLKEYQMAGLQWLVSLYNNNLNGILADDMGLGKTIQTIALIAYLMEFKHNNGPYLIVVPLSTLSNWVNEFSKWAPEIIKVIYKGTPAIRRQIYKDEIETGLFNVLLTTYEYIMKDRSLLKRKQWQYIIVDEGHRMKNAQSKFAQILGTLYQSKHRLLLTGTPLQNNLPELWALLNFLLPTIFSSVDTFDQWFNKPFASFKTSAAAATTTATSAAGGTNGNGDGNSESEVINLTQEERLLIVHRLHEVLRPFMLRRVKSQVLDQLPDKVEKVLRCELSGWQRKLYRIIHRRCTTNKDGELVGGGLNNVIMQLRKVCNHPYLFLSDWLIDDDMIRCSGKFELLDRMLPKLKAGGHRILIFSQMTQVMTILERFFDLKGFAYLRLDGGTGADDREKRMYMFNDPDSPYFIFLLSTRAGGLGLNLATADTVILFDSDWNPMMDAQAQDRAHRIGQKNEVRVFRLITTSAMEEKILSRATDKRNLTGLVVDAGKFNKDNTSNTADDRKEMMAALLKEYGESVEIDEESGVDHDVEVPDDEQINEMMAIYDSELELYQRMDNERRELRLKAWKSYHKTLGTPEMSIPPLPDRLMTAEDIPEWVKNPEVWHSKHSQLLTLSSVSDSALDAAGGKIGGMGDNMTHDPMNGGEVNAYDTGDSDSDGEHSQSHQHRDPNTSKSIGNNNGSNNNNLKGRSSNIANDVKSIGRKRKLINYQEELTDTEFNRMMMFEEPENMKQPVKPASQPVKPPKVAGKSDRPVGRPAKYPKTSPVSNTSGLDSNVSIILLDCIKEVNKLSTPEGYLLTELFRDKPDKRLYRDYYAIIKNPICIKDIMNKLKQGVYTSMAEFEIDLALLSKNARIYNREDSLVYQQSEQIRQEIYTRIHTKLLAKHADSCGLSAFPPPLDDLSLKELSFVSSDSNSNSQRQHGTSSNTGGGATGRTASTKSIDSNKSNSKHINSNNNNHTNNNSSSNNRSNTSNDVGTRSIMKPISKIKHGNNEYNNSINASNSGVDRPSVTVTGSSISGYRSRPSQQQEREEGEIGDEEGEDDEEEGFNLAAFDDDSDNNGNNNNGRVNNNRNHEDEGDLSERSDGEGSIDGQSNSDEMSGSVSAPSTSRRRIRASLPSSSSGYRKDSHSKISPTTTRTSQPQRGNMSEPKKRGRKRKSMSDS